MAITDLKFTEGEFVNNDISSLPNQVTGQAAFLKAKFDNIGKNMVALGKFNDLIDALVATDSGVDASKLGGRLPAAYALLSGAAFTGNLSTAGTLTSGGEIMQKNGVGSTLMKFFVSMVDGHTYLQSYSGNVYLAALASGTRTIYLVASGGARVQNSDAALQPIMAGKFDLDSNCNITRSGTVLIINANAASQAQFRGDKGMVFYNNAATALVNVSAANVTSSTERKKKNIREMTDEEADQILQFVSVAFDWKEDSGLAGPSFSFIAERLAEIDERFIYRNGDGQVEGILANPIMAAQTKVIQRHERTIDGLKKILVSKGVCTQAEVDAI